MITKLINIFILIGWIFINLSCNKEIILNKQNVILNTDINKDIELITINSLDIPMDANAKNILVSENGRYISFFSSATNLVPGVTSQQIYRFDKNTKSYSIVSSDISGVAGDGNVGHLSMSPDGIYFAFWSNSTNLISGVSGARIYWKNMNTGEIRHVSTDSMGVAGNGNSFYTTITDDGSKVAFRSDSNNLYGGFGGNQVYVKNINDGSIDIASTTASELTQNNVAYYPQISANGRYVFFLTQATNLPYATTPSLWKLYRKDMVTRAIVLVNTDSSGTTEPDSDVDGSTVYSYLISKDGKEAIFVSDATNLTVDTLGFKQVFRKNLDTGTIKMLSDDPIHGKSNGDCSLPRGDSVFDTITFICDTTNWIEPLTSTGQLYQVDSSNQISVLSQSLDGTIADSTIIDNAISRDGKFIIWSTSASNWASVPVGVEQIWLKSF